MPLAGPTRSVHAADRDMRNSWEGCWPWIKYPTVPAALRATRTSGMATRRRGALAVPPAGVD